MIYIEYLCACAITAALAVALSGLATIIIFLSPVILH